MVFFYTKRFLCLLISMRWIDFALLASRNFTETEWMFFSSHFRAMTFLKSDFNMIQIPSIRWSFGVSITRKTINQVWKKIIGRVSLCVSFGIYRFSSCLPDWTELCCIKQLSSLLRVSLVQTDKTRRNIKDVCFLEWSEPFRPLTLLILLYFLFLLSHWPADVGRNAHELYRVSPS